MTSLFADPQAAETLAFLVIGLFVAVVVLRCVRIAPDRFGSSSDDYLTRWTPEVDE